MISSPNLTCTLRRTGRTLAAACSPPPRTCAAAIARCPLRPSSLACRHAWRPAHARAVSFRISSAALYFSGRQVQSRPRLFMVRSVFGCSGPSTRFCSSSIYRYSFSASPGSDLISFLSTRVIWKFQLFVLLSCSHPARVVRHPKPFRCTRQRAAFLDFWNNFWIIRAAETIWRFG